MALTDKLTAIADAIRAKAGTSDAMTLAGMAEAIAAISAGGGGATIDSGTYTPAEKTSVLYVKSDVLEEKKTNPSYFMFWKNLSNTYSSTFNGVYIYAARVEKTDSANEYILDFVQFGYSNSFSRTLCGTKSGFGKYVDSGTYDHSNNLNIWFCNNWNCYFEAGGTYEWVAIW